MPNYKRTFRGKLNLDDNPYRVGELDYIDALNITRDSRLNGQDGALTNIVGNRLKTYTLPNGVNKVIGSKEDLVRNRLYFFVWNSNGYHSILYYNQTLDTVFLLLENKTNTYLSQDILNFDPSYRINHIDIIYRDEGDLIYWTDGRNRPMCLDFTYIVNLINASGKIRITDIEMAKQPPFIPPFCWYEDDNAITVNNLRKNLFKFKLRYVYEDLTKSTTSSQGALPLPISENVLTDPPSKNAKISIAFTTGEQNVTKIEILAAHNITNGISDYFLIKSIDKAELGLGDNVVAIYSFYNNEAYNNIDVKESIQAFDYVPQKAFTQSLPNGDVPVYANILEGYDNPIINNNSQILNSQNQFGYQLFTTGRIYCYQNGDSTNTPSSLEISIVAFGSMNIGCSLTITTTNNSIAYNTSIQRTANNFLLQVQTVANGLGYTTSFVGSNILKIVKANEYLKDFRFVGGNPNLLRADFNSSIPCYDLWTNYAFGLIFFDKKGVTNGVVYPANNNVNTIGYELNESPTSNYVVSLPSVNTLLSNLITPNWAYSYQIVRSKRLNKGYFIQWVSEITLKELQGGVLNKSYAYIGINSLDAFIYENPASSYLGYSFTEKDRIRFIANGMQPNGNATNIYTDKDFEIIDYVANPTINGIKYNGKYIKIILPTTSASFDFGTPSFNKYFIEVYKPNQPVSNGLDIYYEFGKQYMCQPSENLSRLYNSTEGDCYGRFRNINTTPLLKWYKDIAVYYALSNTGTGAKISTLDLVQSNNNYTFGGITSYNEAASQTLPPTEKVITLQNDGNTHTFNVKISLKFSLVTANNVANTEIYLQFYDSVGTQTNIPLISFAGSGNVPINGQTYTYSGTATAPAGTVYASVVVFTQFVSTPFVYNFLAFNIDTAYFEMQEINGLIKQFCIDPNFSDYYQSEINSNGRGFVHDVNAKQQLFPTTIRFGGAYQQNTNINQTNRFYEENFDDYDRANGSVQKLFVDGRKLFVMQQFDIGIVPILQQIVSDVTGNPLQAQSDRLLNKIQYPYQAKLGIGNVPESFAYNLNTIFGVDNNRGVVWALSLNGLTELSNVYNIDAFINEKTQAYNTNKNNGIPAPSQPYLGNPTIVGGFDYYTSRYWCSFEQIARYNEDEELIFYQAPFTLTFADTRDDTRGFESFISWFPENIKSLGNLVCTFKNGRLYTHDNTEYCTFDGVTFDAYVKVIFNGSSDIQKTFRSIELISNKPVDIPSIQTSTISVGNTPQESSLKDIDFKLLESNYYTSFFRDINSKGGLFAGDILKGNFIILKLQITSPKSINYYFLDAVKIKTDESKFNLK